MTIIESEVKVNKPVSEVFAFLSNMNNHEKLMPDNIYNWVSTEDEVSFTIQNMAKLAIKISSRVENKELIAIPTEKAPFEIELKWTTEDNGDGTTTAKHILSADLNVMMKMLASGPLQKLVDHQTAQLQAILG
ncbi:SRPBCC family protein [Pedobacter changchengzhani]|uniref:SRPBCC family protein n=1 Tax=Pedobacter changchengzhani TaxID=2529274 RepID=A0A4R5MHL5_9SPHI|nr:SRPBCC family protein [Pedobacter changchengzhani]TDG35012.1 SRPBCC family protein [Pedobacter changchengzhani]